MRDQLISYVELLFAGAKNADDIKQEILQNTLDRYDDLVEQGKSPQAAYSLAISGIGDIGEILEHSADAAEPLPNDDKQLEKAQYIGKCNCHRSLRKSITKIISTIGLCVYFILSFATGAWYITWLIFPIMAAVKQLINAILDLREGN